MACSLNEYAHFLRGLAAGVGGFRYQDTTVDVCPNADFITIRVPGRHAVLFISRDEVDDNLAENIVHARFAALAPPGEPIAPEPIHPVVCAIRNFKPAGTYR